VYGVCACTSAGRGVVYRRYLLVHGGDPGTVTGEVVEKASSGSSPDGYYSQAEPDLINEVGHSVLAVGFTYGCT